jgi:hypothetical protein
MLRMADVTEHEILRTIETNGVAHSLYWCHWPKMRRVEYRHAIVTESDLPCPFFNNVFSADVPDSRADAVVDDLIGRFLSRNVPCFWRARPQGRALVSSDSQIETQSL